MRVEIKKLEPPASVQEMMNMIKNAQSEKSAKITQAYPYSSVQRIVVHLGDGNDSLTVA